MSDNLNGSAHTDKKENIDTLPTSLPNLYRAKGEAITEIEVWQAKLNQINQQIISELNKKQGEK